MLYLIARVTPLSSFQFQQFIRMLCSGMATFIEAVETSDLARRQELVDKMILQIQSGRFSQQCEQYSGGCQRRSNSLQHRGLSRS